MTLTPAAPASVAADAARAPRTGRPVIGVTGPDRGGTVAWWCTWLAIFIAGGKARRIMPSRPLPIDDLEGLVIGGGADVDPELYGEEPITASELIEELGRKERRWRWRYLVTWIIVPVLWLLRLAFRIPRGHGGVDEARDDLETRLIAEALALELPLLGICRGAQLINVQLGGTLYQDLREFYDEEPQVRSVLPRKRIALEPGCRLEQILGASSCSVNALHDQAISQVADPLRVAAREATGVIQAIESRTGKFILGVQWHPEFMPQFPRQRAIFRTLVEEAARRRKAAEIAP